MSNPMPPLLGNGEGCYKVHITGNSGTGKTTTGVALASLLGVPYISLDNLYWEPGWKETPVEEFKAKIRSVLDQNEKGWVIDGSYSGKGGEIVLKESTDLIWLDPPLLLYFPRIFIRTMLRVVGLSQPCSPGCPEKLRETFSSNGILWWCLSNHWKCRRRERARSAELGIVDGSAKEGRKMRRLGGWGEEVKKWLQEVERMCHQNKKGV